MQQEDCHHLETHFFEIDTTFETLQAIASYFRPKNANDAEPDFVRMPKDKWSSV